MCWSGRTIVFGNALGCGLPIGPVIGRRHLESRGNHELKGVPGPWGGLRRRQLRTARHARQRARPTRERHHQAHASDRCILTALLAAHNPALGAAFVELAASLMTQPNRFGSL
jgi:hypothetical protein